MVDRRRRVVQSLALSVALAGVAAPAAPGQGDSALVHVGIALMYDVSAFSQDSGSVQQVGSVPSVGQLRMGRLIVSGLVKSTPAWRYLLSLDYNGHYPGAEHVVSINDLAVIVPVGRGVELDVGRQKEGVTEQMMAGSRNLSLTERPAPITAFIPTRDNGVRLLGGDAQHGRWSFGYFNPEIATAGATASGASIFAGRLFAAPVDVDDGRHLVQLGGSARWKGAPNGSLRFRTKPETNEAPDFPDTKSFNATGATTGGLDLVLQHDALSLTSEAVLTSTARRDSSTLTFGGWFVEASWRPGGEARIYDASTGALGTIRLRENRPAWQLAGRFSHVDLSSQDIDGGTFDRTSVSLSWRTARSLLLELEYGYGVLDRGGVTGHTRFMTTRLQWERH